MPTFLITSPDGSKFNVTSDNADGALAALKPHLCDMNFETDAGETLEGLGLFVDGKALQ